MSRISMLGACLSVVLSVSTTGCAKKAGAEAGAGSGTGPTPTTVERVNNASHFKVDRPERFPLVEATEYVASPELNVTAVVSPDLTRQVPVISLASGRIVEMDVKLGDSVKKGQMLFRVRSPDIAQAYSDYRKAVINEQLANVQLKRAEDLFEKGAIPRSGLETAQNTEDNAKVDVDTTLEHLRVLGSDPDHASGSVPIYAPISGVITDQQITDAAGVQALNTPSPLTISDMSHVWVLCDVYENDLSQVHLGEFADVHLNAYPDRLLKARIANIGEILDPNIRTAKVRLEVENPGVMRLGMFATATFHGRKKDTYAALPATAILHLQDRYWVYAWAGDGYFERYEVVSGNMLPGNLQEILSGIKPGTKVARNALDLQSTVSE
jgi:cobalt-zinc-cadmium efflux system membrane fusion protein